MSFTIIVNKLLLSMKDELQKEENIEVMRGEQELHRSLTPLNPFGPTLPLVPLIPFLVLFCS